MAKVKPIYRNGKKLSNQEIRNTIMKANNIKNVRDYEKYYDITRNKLRNYEAFTGKQNKQSVREFLYKEASAKLRYGASYKPTIERERIAQFTTMSTGKAQKATLKSERWQKKQKERYASSTYKQFEGLIKANPKAKEIFESIDDPFKREQALIAFANKLHARLDATGKATGATAIPERNEVFGSDTFDDFDYSSYLD